jgi:hypothetical protein
MTVVDVVQYVSGRPKPARFQVGLVRMPDTGEIQLAGQLAGRSLFVLSPSAAVRIIGVLREGLTSL